MRLNYTNNFNNKGGCLQQGKRDILPDHLSSVYSGDFRSTIRTPENVELKPNRYYAPISICHKGFDLFESDAPVRCGDTGFYVKEGC
jgi:hypothetical protein